MNNEISNAIEKAVREQTFTPDALKLFTDTIEKVKALEREIEAKAGEITNREDQKKSAERLYQGEFERAEALDVRVKALEEREDGVKESEKQVATAGAELKGFTEAMQMVFKPVVTRTSIQGHMVPASPANPSNPNDYGSGAFMDQSATQETTVTEE